MTELEKAIEALKSSSINKKNRYEILIDFFNINKNKIKIDKSMFEIIANKGDFKQKEKINFDKKYFIKNGEVFRKSDYAMLPWFELSKIIYQKDLVNYYCYFNNEKKVLSKNAWLVINDLAINNKQ